MHRLYRGINAIEVSKVFRRKFRCQKRGKKKQNFEEGNLEEGKGKSKSNLIERLVHKVNFVVNSNVIRSISLNSRNLLFSGDINQRKNVQRKKSEFCDIFAKTW